MERASPAPPAIRWMTAEAIRAAAANFHDCLERLWPLAARRGVSRATFDAYTAALTPDLRIMDLLDAQPEFTKSFWDYLDILVSDARIETGREMLAQYRATFDAVEQAYGVDRYVIAAIWGVESNYGTIGGDRPVIRSTATLACVGRRQDYFREEFLSALEILQRGDVSRTGWSARGRAPSGRPSSCRPRSSATPSISTATAAATWSNSVPDVIASTANNLKKDGWVTGQTWGYEVVVPANFNFLLADRARVMTIREWERHGLTRPGGKPFPRPDDRAYLLVPAGVQGPGFLMLQNFRVIMKYNPAEAYALAIGHLADRLRGGGPFVQELAALRTRAVARRAAGVAATAGAARLRRRRAGRPARRPDPRRDPRFPGQDRAGARRLCLGGRARAAARPLSA